MNPLRMSVLVALFATLAPSASAQAQTVSPQVAQGEPVLRNAAYIELAGNALIYSLNIDRLVTRHVSVRGGLMLLPDPFSGRWEVAKAAPLMVNGLIGRDGRYFEIGGGTVLGIGDTDSDLAGNVTLTLGYRYQRDHHLFRVGYTPVFRPHVRPLVQYQVFGGQYFTLPGTGGRPWRNSFGVSYGRSF